jgi:hypothetical protein
MRVILPEVNVRAFALAVFLLAGTVPTLPTLAQVNHFETIANLKRAQNQARFAGERAHGGINVYRTEPAMHQTVGTVGEAHYEDVGDAMSVTIETASNPRQPQTLYRTELKTLGVKLGGCLHCEIKQHNLVQVWLV